MTNSDLDFNPQDLFELEVSAKPIINNITIVIPTVGRELLATCLRYMAEGTHWPQKITVVDQSSSQHVADYIAKMNEFGIQAEHVMSNQTGRSSGLNRGLERVETKYVLITDDDCLVDSNWLMAMSTRLNDNPESIISGRVEPEGDEEVLSIITSLEPAIYTKPMLKVDPMFGGNMGIAIKHVRRLGYFDEGKAVISSEDNDFGYRALRSGITIMYAPEVVVRHIGWRGADQRARRYRAYARSQGGFYGKYMRKGDWFMAIRALRDQLRGPYRWVRGIFSNDPDAIASGRAYTFYLAQGIWIGLTHKSKV